MAKDHGAPEAGQLPKPVPEVVERQRVAKDRATQRLRSWTVPNEMINILGRVSAGAAERILDSANPEEMELNRKLCPLQRKRERTQRTFKVAQPREPVCQRISMRQYAYNPRKEKSGYERQEERGYKGLWRAQVALPVWPAHQPRCSPGETSVQGPIVA